MFGHIKCVKERANRELNPANNNQSSPDHALRAVIGGSFFLCPPSLIKVETVRCPSDRLYLESIIFPPFLIEHSPDTLSLRPCLSYRPPFRKGGLLFDDSLPSSPPFLKRGARRKIFMESKTEWGMLIPKARVGDKKQKRPALGRLCIESFL